MLNMMVMSDFLFEASITSKTKVDFPRLLSKMADTCVQEDMEVEENPGESPKVNDLNVIINGKNNKYMIIIIFRAIFHKRTVKFGFFSLSKKVNLKSDLKSNILAIVIITVMMVAAI